MTETIQQLKKDITILQEKLQKFEEKEPDMMLLRQGKVDFVNYDGKDGKKYIRIEYTDSFADDYIWYMRRVGEDAIRPVRDVNVYAPLEELYQKEVVKQKDDYPYKKYTPEETEKGLRDAMKQAKKDGVFDKSPLDIINEWAEKNKPPTLYQILMNWWVNVNLEQWCDEEVINSLIDVIDKEFIPPHHDTNDYQWNKCLKLMRNKLR